MSSPLARGYADCLVIGQGVAGTWLSYFLEKEGKTSITIDNALDDSPSRVAAGIINPVTGRRYAEVWMADKLLPFAWEAYSLLGEEWGINAISQKNIIDFFPSVQMRQSFMQRVDERANYISVLENTEELTSSFRFELGAGVIGPAYTAHLENLLPAGRSRLKEQQSLLEETFDFAQLHVEQGKIRYKDLRAEKIIFCDGSASAGNPYFSNLPFALNKGEAIIAEIPGLPEEHIYKKGMLLVPMAKADHWWIGSSYEWDYQDVAPSRIFRERTEALLRDWVKLPFRILDHKAGIRPATLERRPFVGLHPHHRAIGMLNGLGTKGCSLAPFFASQLVRHIFSQAPIEEAAGLDRFQKILLR